MAMAKDDVSPALQATLPEELCLDIITKLDMPSIIALSQTCRRFSRLSDPTDMSRRPLLDKFLIEAQSFSRWREGFACFSCTKVLSRDRFADAQTRKKRGRNGSEQKGRFCIQCGIGKGRHSPGSMVVQGNVIRMVCRQCKRLRGGRFCQRCTICSHCDRNRATLKECENDGHTIIGDALSSVETVQAFPICPITALGLGFHMTEYEAMTGETASPEWYDGPDDIGP